MSTNFAYQIKENSTIVIFSDGKLVTIGKNDINYEKVFNAIKIGDYETASKALNIKSAIADVSDGRVSIYGDDVYVDDRVLPAAVSKRVAALLKNTNFNIKPLFRVLENIEQNPNDFSRNELYLFLEHNDLPFTPDGCFLAYKMVDENYYDLYTGTIRNMIGDKPEMPREEVDPNRYNTCSTGLHFCSFNYLSRAYCMDNKRYHLMVVKVNPADVVSIPNDYDNAKGRCWKYEVVGELEHFDDSLPKGYTDEFSDDVTESPFELVADDWGSTTNSAFERVRAIRAMLKNGATLAAISRATGLSPRQIGRIRDGECWKYVA